MAIRLALFDYDGTIVFTETVHTRHLADRLNQFGIRYTTNDLSVLAGANPSTRPALFDRCFLDQEAYRLHREELLYHRIRPISTAELSTLLAPGLIDFLTWLKKKNISCAICTNSTSGRIEEGLAALHISSYFSHIYSGYELGHNKPDPYIYQLAMHEYDIIPPETIIFEDSMVGLTGAYQTGAHICAVLDPANITHPGESEFSINSFLQAPAIIESLSQHH